MAVGAAAAVVVAVVPPVGLGDDLSLNGGGDVGDGVAALVVAAGGGCASHGRESGRSRASEHRGVSRRRGWRGESGGASGRVLAGLGSDRRGGRGDSAVVLVLARAESDGDVGVLRASLHTVGVVGSVTVSLLLRRAGAGLGVGSDHPVAVPWVAVDLAQVVPDGAVILEGVLVLEDVVQILVLGELEGPASASGQLLPLRRVAAARVEGVLSSLVAAVLGGDDSQLDVVAAHVLNDGVADRLGHGRAGHEGSSCSDELHFDRLDNRFQSWIAM